MLLLIPRPRGFIGNHLVELALWKLRAFAKYMPESFWNVAGLVLNWVPTLIAFHGKRAHVSGPRPCMPRAATCPSPYSCELSTFMPWPAPVNIARVDMPGFGGFGVDFCPLADFDLQLRLWCGRIDEVSGATLSSIVEPDTPLLPPRAQHGRILSRATDFIATCTVLRCSCRLVYVMFM